MAKYGIILKTTQTWVTATDKKDVRTHEVVMRAPVYDYKEASRKLADIVLDFGKMMGRLPDKTGVLGGWCGGYATWLGGNYRDDLTIYVNQSDN